jgi:hypothetical protein
VKTEPLEYATARPAGTNPPDRLGQAAFIASVLSCPLLTMFVLSAAPLTIPLLNVAALAMGVWAAVERRRRNLPVTASAIAAIAISIVWLIVVAGMAYVISRIEMPVPSD